MGIFMVTIAHLGVEFTFLGVGGGGVTQLPQEFI